MVPDGKTELFWTQKVFLRFSPAVLVPGLDLGVAELQRGRQLHAVLDAQVLLLLEASLQPGQLLVAERRPSFARFLQPDAAAVVCGPAHYCRSIGERQMD